jgi:hypothetical protein
MIGPLRQAMEAAVTTCDRVALLAVQRLGPVLRAMYRASTGVMDGSCPSAEELEGMVSIRVLTAHIHTAFSLQLCLCIVLAFYHLSICLFAYCLLPQPHHRMVVYRPVPAKQRAFYMSYFCAGAMWTVQLFQGKFSWWDSGDEDDDLMQVVWLSSVQVSQCMETGYITVHNTF